MRGGTNEPSSRRIWIILRLIALAQGADSSLILFRDGNWSEAAVIARMGEILRLLEPADLARSIIVVDRSRIRRRRLPLSRG